MKQIYILLLILSFIAISGLMNCGYASDVLNSTLLGTRLNDPIDAYYIAVDTAGNAYVAGQSAGQVGPFDDIFILKLNPNLTTLLNSMVISGNSYDFINGIALDTACNIYISGHTQSTDFPTTPGAYDRTKNGLLDIFCTKYNANGNMSFSTFLAEGNGNAIAVDNEGNAYITGLVDESSVFPTTPGAFDTTYHSCFITKFNPTGSGLVYSTFLGGTNESRGCCIAVDSMGNAYISGYTRATDFPTTAGAFDNTYNGSGLDRDLFITKLNPTGTALVYSTYLGGSGDETDEHTLGLLGIDLDK
jgi:hypothetical protein